MSKLQSGNVEVMPDDPLVIAPDELFYNRLKEKTDEPIPGFSTVKLPPDAEFVRETPDMNQDTVPSGILHRHTAPEGMYGVLSVKAGHLFFVWEDTHERNEIKPGSPQLIVPGRFHHVELDGPVRFRIRFYKVRS